MNIHNKKYIILTLSILLVMIVIISILAFEKRNKKETSIIHKPKDYKTDVYVYALYDQNGLQTLKDIEQNSKLINQIETFTYHITKTGDIAGYEPNQSKNYADQNGIYMEACINNLINGTFDQKTLDNVLNNPDLSEKLQEQMLILTKEKNYSGISIDFENVSASDKESLVNFLSGLHEKLKKVGKSLSIALPPTTGSQILDEWSAGYDVQKIGQNVDNVILMAYDYSYAGGKPGPIAPTPWVKQLLDYNTKLIPSEKIILGINAYGYDWTNGHGQAFGLKYIDNLIKQKNLIPQYDQKNDAPYLQYLNGKDNHILYYENEVSIKDKLNLAKEYGLGGIAIWRIGLENDIIWNQIKNYKKNQIKTPK